MYDEYSQYRGLDKSSPSRKNLRCRQKHARDQKANDDVMVMQSVGPIMMPQGRALWAQQCDKCRDRTSLPAALVCQREVNTGRLILHPTCVIKPAVDGCPLVAANSMEIEKVRSFLLQIREKDHAAPLGGISG
jgi:hypothetical protein